VTLGTNGLNAFQETDNLLHRSLTRGCIAQLSIQVYLKDTIEKLIRMNNNRLPVRYEPIHAGHLWL